MAFSGKDSSLPEVKAEEKKVITKRKSYDYQVVEWTDHSDSTELLENLPRGKHVRLKVTQELSWSKPARSYFDATRVKILVANRGKYVKQANGKSERDEKQTITDKSRASPVESMLICNDGVDSASLLNSYLLMTLIGCSAFSRRAIITDSV
jgi:hypothetical protein